MNCLTLILKTHDIVKIDEDHFIVLQRLLYQVDYKIILLEFNSGEILQGVKLSMII
jgi:hypothetical protein